MLPFENKVADYIKETGNHVLYRVTPIYQDKNLVASGVLMEAQSVEDDTVKFCVYCYNVQPDVQIDYATGKSSLVGSQEVSEAPDQNATYILNENSKKIHTPDCPSVQDTKPKIERSTTDHFRISWMMDIPVAKLQSLTSTEIMSVSVAWS